MRKVFALIMTVLPLLAGCGSREVPVKKFATATIEDGKTLSVVGWEDDGFTTSTRPMVIYGCTADKKNCQALTSGIVQGQGYISILTAVLHSAAAGVGGALALPRPTGSSGGTFISAPETLVQTNVGLAK